MYSEEVKIEDMIAHLNSLVGGLTGQRFGYDKPEKFSKKADDLHDAIVQRCEPYLASLGLRIGSWGASLAWDENSDIHIHSGILKYSIPGFLKDGRYKLGWIGKLTSPPLWSANYENGIRDDKNPLIVTAEPGWTLRRYVLEIHRAEKADILASAEAWVENLQSQLKEAHKRVAVAGAELDLTNDTITREFVNI